VRAAQPEEAEEEDIWGGSKPAAQAQPAVSVASKLAATFAAQPRQDTLSKPAVNKQQQAKPTAAPAATTPTAASSAAPATPVKSTSKPSENSFGGPSMSVEFESFCRSSLEQLTGSSDLTLAHFLLTLDSRSQIEEYIAEYLGRSPESAKFTAGFIRHRDQALAKSQGSSSAAAFGSPLPASAAVAAQIADAKRKKQNRKK